MLLVWRGQSVTLALPTLTPPLAARSQDSPGPAPVPSLQDYFYPTFYEQLSESTLESTSWLSQDPGKPAGSSCLPLSFLSDQGSQTERWVSIQGEEGWRQPCSAVPHAEGQRSETTAKAKMGRCSNDEIRARQPKATLCHSFHSWQGLAEARLELLPSRGSQNTCTQHTPRVGKGVDWDWHIRDLSPSFSWSQNIANISPEPAIGGL